MKRAKRIFRIALAASLIFLAGQACAETPDRYEKLNRKTHAFNEFLDSKLVRPVAKGYSEVMPKYLQARVRSFFRNLGLVNVLANDIMQGKPEASLTDGARLLLNTTIGVGGLYDPAGKIGLYANDEDWGQTLAVWGVGSGGYVVLPGYGPSTVRDSLTLMVDSFFNPLYAFQHVPTRNTLWVVDKIQRRTDLLPLESFVVGDKYEFYRDAYLQHREFQIKDGEIEDSFGDDF